MANEVVSPVRQIGITGGIGSGKSTVCAVFRLLGVPVYEADARAKWLMANNDALINEIRLAFGAGAYDADRRLNRRYLAEQVFTNSDKVTQLNQLVHPRVADDYAEWLTAHLSAPYVLKEAALIYESGSYRQLHQIIVVYAPVALRIGRIQQRDSQRSEAEIRAIMAKQLDDAEKVRRADYVIDNDDSRLVIPQVLALHRQFTAPVNKSA